MEGVKAPCRVCSLCREPIQGGEDIVPFDRGPVHKRCYEALPARPLGPPEEVTIVKGYRVFKGAPTGEPMDEPDESRLFGWLRTRGYPVAEANELIREVDLRGLITVTIPKQV